MMEIVVYALLAIGLFFQAMGAIALHRFPDVYTRMHGTTKCTTLGSIFMCSGVVVYGAVLAFSGEAQYAILSVHSLVAALFLLLTNPAGAHAIARAAHRSGVMPKLAVVDRLQEAKKDDF
ncbi:MAG: monovalent cation/H(+) antiporter subunit G [Candidatus Diapherotrites archaeon]|nr:monovalent cation/H(+) antiporter subunit G [Candidatus Diapherotrites archaeon]